MAVYQKTISITTSGKGTLEISRQVESVLGESGLSAGTVTVFCKHTSCSLVLMENADPSARTDLEAFMEKLVPESLSYFIHTYEGPDDMPSHIKMALTRSSEIVPFTEGILQLGTWQGIFLWEHRSQSHTRKINITIIGE